MKYAFHKVENTEGRGENAGYQHFLLFPQRFQKASISGSLKVGIVWYKEYVLFNTGPALGLLC